MFFVEGLDITVYWLVITLSVIYMFGFINILINIKAKHLLY